MSRQEVFNKIRRQLGVSEDDKTRIQTVDNRLSQHPNNTIPARAMQTQDKLVDLFQKKMEAAQGSVERINCQDEIISAIFTYLDVDACELTINTQSFEDLGLASNPNITIVPWSAKASLGICLSDCFGAVAETGSLVVSSSTTMPLSFNFLGEKHIVLLRREQIVGAYEDIWNLTRNDMPRDLTLVSGPSCTGDIEMIMEYGAHGPKALHVIIIDE